MKLIALLGILVCSVVCAQSPRVSTQLLADHSSVSAGEEFHVGVLFEIEPDWHIYWKYPGDAGMATMIKWSVPEGFTVSDIIWPTPTRFTQEGDIDGYGYEGSVMLLAKVLPPKDYSGPATIKAQVRWLACKTICVIGRSSLETTVNVGANSSPSNSETFAQWLKRVPMDLGESPLEVDVRRSGLVYELTVRGVPQTAELDVYVAPPDGATVKRIDRTGNKATIELAKLAGADVSGSAEVVVGNNNVHARVLLPLD